MQLRLLHLQVECPGRETLGWLFSVCPGVAYYVDGHVSVGLFLKHPTDKKTYCKSESSIMGQGGK